jgi:hypothetical protein
MYTNNEHMHTDSYLHMLLLLSTPNHTITTIQQINQFEEAFAADNGHVPRGRERAALASTYSQYKQWKRIIRSDAATQIQVHSPYNSYMYYLRQIESLNSISGNAKRA